MPTSTVPPNYYVGTGANTRLATQAEWDRIQQQRAANARNRRNIKIGTAVTAGLMTAGVAAGAGGAAAGVPGAVSGVPITAASQAAAMGIGTPSIAGLATSAAGAGSLAPIAGGAPWALTPLAGTAGMSGTGAGASTMAASTGLSKGALAFSAISGFLRDFLGSKSARTNEKVRAQAELALKELEMAHEKGLLDKKILADESDKDPFRHALNQISAAEAMDRLSSITPLVMQPGGRKIGRYDVPSYSGGALSYDASPELRQAAAASRAAVLRGEGQAPSVVGGPDPMAAGRPNPRTGVLDLIAAGTPGRAPVSSTMPVDPFAGRGTFPTQPDPRLVGAGSLVDAPVSSVPAPPDGMRMSIEDLIAALPTTGASSRTRARRPRRALPAALPMR